MRSTSTEVAASSDDDRSTKARIRDAAIDCFATQGVADTTVRAVAAVAGVSPGLVMHHFGSMDGLRTACDQYVAAVIRDRKDEVLSTGPQLDLLGAMRNADYGNLIAYVARVLVDDSEAVDRLMDDLVADAEVYMQHGVDAGTLRPSPDPRSRAALLTLWILGGLVLHRHMKRLLGVDLTDPDVAADPVFTQYVRPALEILGAGVLADEFHTQVEGLLGSDPED